jgi:predicted HicB family RNase H-like nuclease
MKIRISKKTRLMTNEPKTTNTASTKPVRGKLNLTIHPEIKEFAVALANARRDTVSQLFEDLVEVEWNRIHGIVSHYPPPKTYVLSRPGHPPVA